MSDVWAELILDAHRQVDVERKRRDLPPFKWADHTSMDVTGVLNNIMETEDKQGSGSGKSEVPLSTLVAQRGIKTSADFAEFMGALMSDLVEGLVKPEVAKAACLAADKLLMVAKMQLQFGELQGDQPRVLQLTGKTKAKP